MPIVMVDKTNCFWVAEDPVSGELLAGYKAKGGQAVRDLLDFATSRGKQFEKFSQKRKEEELRLAQQNRGRFLSEGRRTSSSTKE